MKKTNKLEDIGKIVLAARPKSYTSSSTRFETGCGSLFVHISVDEGGNPVEVFGTMGKAGGCAMAMLEAVGKATSIGLRCGVDPTEYVKQFVGIRCPSPKWEAGEQHLSCIDAMGKGLRITIDQRDKQKVEQKAKEEVDQKAIVAEANDNADKN